MNTQALSQRPAAAIGHVGPLLVSDLSVATEFYAALGMRIVMQHSSMAILELRGGTHLILREGRASSHVGFDVMVDDIDEARRSAIARGLEPGSLRHGGIHHSFHLVDPDGRTVSITSSHAMGAI